MKSLEEYLSESFIVESENIDGTLLALFDGTIKTAAEKRSVGWTHYDFAATIKNINKAHKAVPVLTGVGGKKLGCADATKFLSAILFELKASEFGVSTIDELISKHCDGSFGESINSKIKNLLTGWGIDTNELSFKFDVNWTEYRNYYTGAKVAANARWEIVMEWRSGTITWKIDSNALAEENRPHLK